MSAPEPSSPPDLVTADGPSARRPTTGPGSRNPGPADPAERPQAGPGPGPRDGSGPARMTGRGAVLAMFAVFFLGTVMAGWLHLGVLTGLSFVTGCALAARYTKRDGLLTAVVTPPLIFMIALVIIETLSSHGGSMRHTLTSAAEGVVLTLASVAPWLFSGVILGVIVALFRGLTQSVRDLRAELRGDHGLRPPPTSGPPAPRPEASGYRRRGAATRAGARTPSAPAPPRPQ